MTHDATIPTIGGVSDALDRIAPPALAQPWDNVGLLAGDRSAGCSRVLLCIDLTPPVLDEAIAAKTDLVVAYHPLIFQAIKRLTAQSNGTDAIAFRAIRAGIAIYSPHTALDAAPGGTNDVIASFCGLTQVQPFEYVGSTARQFKLVTFVPAEQLETLASALFTAGAGHIGEYEQCSFRLSGEGTFFGSQTTQPRIGERGRLERVAETRLEVIVSERRLPEVIAALRGAHPYEEPAFDTYPLEPAPVPGIGRVGQLPEGTKLGGLAAQLTARTQSRVTALVGDRERTVRTAAICVGATGRLPLEKWRSAASDVIITGEMSHHDALTLLRRGQSAIALGHWESERPALTDLRARLAAELPGIEIVLSAADRGPFTPV